MKSFYFLLANTVIASVTNMTVWFALIFFIFLETKSVFATAMCSGIYLTIVALSGFWLGSIVDHNKKKRVMLLSSIVSLAIYSMGALLFLASPDGAFSDPTSVWLWILVVLLLIGVITGNLRTIAIPTVVTIMVPENRRDKANGLTGTATGISFLVVSVISGLLIGFGGMDIVLYFAIVMTVLAIAHLLTVTIPEKDIVHTEDNKKEIDLAGTITAVRAVPGLLALILFATFNNFLGGVFMALMDAYGLSLVSVQVWGLLWGALSCGFIVGGLAIAKWGLGKNPLRMLFITNFVIWTISSFFTIVPSIILLAIGMFIYICFVPVIEATEHTIIQKVVPHERQGRVFGFAQSVEQSASPFMAFLIGPIAQFIFIPFMTTGNGVTLIGDWFGTGPDRGIALVFTVAGLTGLLMTFIAFRSKYYRLLSRQYLSD